MQIRKFLRKGIPTFYTLFNGPKNYSRKPNILMIKSDNLHLHTKVIPLPKKQIHVKGIVEVYHLHFDWLWLLKIQRRKREIQRKIKGVFNHSWQPSTQLKWSN